MPTSVDRLLLCLAALCAALVLGGAGAGLAGADPDDSGNSSEPGPSSESGPVSEPAPTVATPVAPRGPLGHLREALQRPRSIFGSGRTPGHPPKPEPDPEAKPDPTVELPEGSGTEITEPEVPAKKLVGSSAEITLPGAVPFSVPLPTFPGTSDTQWSINLSDPQSTYSTVQDTFSTLNSLVSEAYAPYNPFPPPPPEPTLKIMEEEPVVDSAGGGTGLTSTSEGTPEMPMLQAPPAFPALKLGPPRPLAEIVPAGTTGQVLGVGTAGVRAPEGRSVTQGSVPAGEAAPGSTTSPMGNTAYRQGFPQYLRTARVGELAIVALPGIAGLLAITASGGAIGFRQANSGRYLRSDAARFLQ
ncbi:MAG: hypothetical protein QOF88_1352 [Mycobacterium sp.]|nr:hypothetical protein [Mycobacterium sp.]